MSRVIHTLFTAAYFTSFICFMLVSLIKQGYHLLTTDVKYVVYTCGKPNKEFVNRKDINYKFLKVVTLLIFKRSSFI